MLSWKGAVIGFVLGAGVGLGLLAVGLRASGWRHSMACPSGHAPETPLSIGAARALATCVDTARGGRHHVGVYWSSARIGLDREARALFDEALRSRGHDPRSGAYEDAAGRGDLRRTSWSRDASTVPLIADVYFVSGGRRFGLLTVVHAPDATLGQPQATAQWMSTLGGTAPWGAPNDVPFTARCPDGFRTMASTAPRSVVRCTRGIGTSEFVAINMSWDEGGFGREEDRSRVATALAERIAQSQGATARVVSGPIAFTLARNVDAMHTRVATGETASITWELTLSAVAGGRGRLFALTYGEPSAQAVDLAESMLPASLLRESGVLSRMATRVLAMLAFAWAMVFAVLGAVLFRAKPTRSRDSA